MSRDPWGTSDPRDPFVDTLYKHGYRPLTWHKRFAWLPVRTSRGRLLWLSNYYEHSKITVAFNGNSKKKETLRIVSEREYLLEILKSS